MNLAQLLEALQKDDSFAPGIQAWISRQPRDAVTAPFPEDLPAPLIRALKQRGISALYKHQRAAIDAIRAGQHVVISTPTASGKSLCYTLPILQRFLENQDGRSLMIFPTKALAQDQRAEFQGWIDWMGLPMGLHTYDGDTSPTVRKTIRSAGHVVLTNPDMLHTGILPHHTKWVRLFENLEYVVIDELHTYRGVFGSHVANVLRRLQRIARFYGSDPVFITCSATIANPAELAEQLLGAPCHHIHESGAPEAEKTIVFYNPPVVNPTLGIRQSVVLAARKVLRSLITNDIQTIAFARSRLRVEVLLSYLRKDLPAATIRGYRGGYLPGERRSIERGLRSGSIDAVVATHALELGIDIGSLAAAVLVGYPGSIASTWQQMGRAGRTDEASLAILIASSNPLDQHIITHPDYFFEQSPEAARVHPDNLLILLSHIKCAAFELPFRQGDLFGSAPLEDVLRFLESHRVLHHYQGTWYWMAESFPAEEISLRSAAPENVVIIDQTRPEHQVIGEVDQFSAPMLVHEGAIYLHETQQYQVERLDLEEAKAYVRAVNVNYYTDAALAVDVRVLDEFRSAPLRGGRRDLGEVKLTAQATLYKKIRFETHENVGWGRIHLPPRDMHTSAAWLVVPEAVAVTMGKGPVEAALFGLAHLLGQVAPLYLFCDRHDLFVVPQVRSPHTQLPTLFLCDAYPGGVGLAERGFAMLEEMLLTAAERLRECECSGGCPSCVGVLPEAGGMARAATLQLLEQLGVGG